MEKQDFYFVEVRDRAMVPEFEPGDRLVIDPGGIPEPGRFFVVGKWYIRRLSEDGQVWESLNPDDFPPLPAADYAILGRVTQRNRKV